LSGLYTDVWSRSANHLLIADAQRNQSLGAQRLKHNNAGRHGRGWIVMRISGERNILRPDAKFHHLR